MSELCPADFRIFFEAVYGYEPFPWQVRLAEKATADGGRWPDAIDVPTASGKTACLDVAVFSLALQADWPADRIRTAPRRIFFVVDRRVIVEEAYQRARQLAQRLRRAMAQAEEGIVREVAERLRRLAIGNVGQTSRLPVKPGESDVQSVADWLSNQPPLACYQMRGGIYRDHAWARTPIQPMVITSTVDQIGSRLLYRGYGVSEFSRPLHAALTANDSLIILDEAHCSEPFSQTMRAIARYRECREPNAVGQSNAAPFHFVMLSATPSSSARDVLKIEQEDENHQVLGKRIRASKPTRLVVADKAKGRSWLEPLAKEITEQAMRLQRESGLQAVGVIVNRVATARDVRRVLAEKLGEKADVVLMTGRMREVDRREFLARWQPKLAAKPNFQEERQFDKPVFVVATQCLEVGANLDFDAMVCECASLDAIRQRFGRLNRLGQRDVAPAVIVIRGDQTEAASDAKKVDPIYGEALPRTWKWLKEHSSDGVIDLGIAAVKAMLPADESERRNQLTELQPNHVDAPTMLPAHLDCWVQTSPRPRPDPDVSLFLHGPQRSQPDIQVCWRADLVPTVRDEVGDGFTREQLGDDAREEAWLEALSLCAPTAAECLPVPLHLFERWIKTGRVDTRQLSDVEGAEAVETEPEEAMWSAKPCVRWYGPNDERTKLLRRNPYDLQPGDTVVLPSWAGGFRNLGDVGGLDDFNVTDQPERTAAADRGDEANLFARFKPVLRIHELLVEQWPACAARDRLRELAKDPTLADRLHDAEFAAELSDSLEQLASQLEDLPDRHLWKWLMVSAEALAGQLRRSSKRARLHFMSYGWTLAGEDQQLVQRNLAHKGGFAIVGERLSPDQSRRLFDDSRADDAELLEADTFTHDDDSSSTSVSGPVTLKDHTAGVCQLAQRFASACGLSPQLAADIDVAARLHDLGKADPRFQAWLLGGNVRAARMARELLAKSGQSLDRSANRMARERSGYPSKGRHEFLSVRLGESAVEVLDGAFDPDVVLHLIAAHHGRCRPFAPVIDDLNAPEPPLVLPWDGHTFRAPLATRLERLDSGVAERFWRLVRRYGWWGIAWLETILILADRCESEREQQRKSAAKDGESEVT